MHKAWRSIEKVPYCFFRASIKFQGYMGKKIDDLIPILSKITRPVAAIKSLTFAFVFFQEDAFQNVVCKMGFVHLWNSFGQH